MKKMILSVAAAVSAVFPVVAQQVKFDGWFFDRTMRYDYYHAVDRKMDVCYFD